MLKSVITATENFCIHQIRVKYAIKNEITIKRTLIAYIDIKTQDDKQHRVYLACDQACMQAISKLFLEEDESDEETLIDMTLETVNLIVGSAKVIAENTDNPYTISTPHFEKIGQFDYDYDESRLITMADNEMMIAIKDLNA